MALLRDCSPLFAYNINMLANIFIYFITLFVNFLALIFSAFNVLVPNWIQSGISGILSGSTRLNALLPMYAHPSMSGIAGQTGLMPMFGFLLVMLGAVILIRLGFVFVNFILRLIPWNTSKHE